MLPNRGLFIIRCHNSSNGQVLINAFWVALFFLILRIISLEAIHHSLEKAVKAWKLPDGIFKRFHQKMNWIQTYVSIRFNQNFWNKTCIQHAQSSYSISWSDVMILSMIGNSHLYYIRYIISFTQLWFNQLCWPWSWSFAMTEFENRLSHILWNSCPSFALAHIEMLDTDSRNHVCIAYLY